MGDMDRNKRVVADYWDAHFERDWERMAEFFTENCHYTDVGIDSTGATGPEEIILRLRLGIEPLSEYLHVPRHVVAEGDLVVTEHVEIWGFRTGERIEHPFTSVMEVTDGRIRRWHDYSHLGNLIDNAPRWWLDHVAGGWKGT